MERERGGRARKSKMQHSDKSSIKPTTDGIFMCLFLVEFCELTVLVYEHILSYTVCIMKLYTTLCLIVLILDCFQCKKTYFVNNFICQLCELYGIFSRKYFQGINSFGS